MQWEDGVDIIVLVQGEVGVGPSWVGKDRIWLAEEPLETLMIVCGDYCGHNRRDRLESLLVQ